MFVSTNQTNTIDMNLELKKQKIQDGANYLKSRYDYINKFDGIKLLANMKVGIDLQMALKSWKIAYED
jgi:hypothetical protein